MNFQILLLDRFINNDFNNFMDNTYHQNQEDLMKNVKNPVKHFHQLDDYNKRFLMKIILKNKNQEYQTLKKNQEIYNDQKLKIDKILRSTEVDIDPEYWLKRIFSFNQSKIIQYGKFIKNKIQYDLIKKDQNQKDFHSEIEQQIMLNQCKYYMNSYKNYLENIFKLGVQRQDLVFITVTQFYTEYIDQINNYFLNQYINQKKISQIDTFIQLSIQRAIQSKKNRVQLLNQLIYSHEVLKIEQSLKEKSINFNLDQFPRLNAQLFETQMNRFFQIKLEEKENFQSEELYEIQNQFWKQLKNYQKLEIVQDFKVHATEFIKKIKIYRQEHLYRYQVDHINLFQYRPEFPYYILQSVPLEIQKELIHSSNEEYLELQKKNPHIEWKKIEREMKIGKNMYEFNLVNWEQNYQQLILLKKRKIFKA